MDKLPATPSEHSLSTAFPNKPLYLGKDPEVLAMLSHRWETTGQKDVAKTDHKSVSLIA